MTESLILKFPYFHLVEYEQGEQMDDGLGDGEAASAGGVASAAVVQKCGSPGMGAAGDGRGKRRPAPKRARGGAK